MLHDALAKGRVAPVAGGADIASEELCGVDVGPCPGGLGVHPDVIVALGSPGTFGHGDETSAGIFVEILGAADEL